MFAVRKLTAPLAAAALLLSVGPGPSPAAKEPLLDAKSVDWVKLVGPPPAPGSQKAREDLAIVLWVQRTRSRADVDRIWAAMSPGVAAFQQAIGTMVLPTSFPGVYGTVQAGLDVATPVFSPLKSRWDRPRPPQVDEAVKPCTPTPDSGSYPSGTAVLGIVAGRLLADLIPERKHEISERADEIAELRVAAGVHFPSDVEAGVRLGNAIADQILASDAWAARREAVRPELEALKKQLASAKSP